MDHPIHFASKELQQEEAGHETGGAKVPDHQTSNTGQEITLMLFQEFSFRVVVDVGAPEQWTIFAVEDWGRGALLSIGGPVDDDFPGANPF